MEVFKQTQAAAGMVGAASAGTTGSRGDVDTLPRDGISGTAGLRDPNAEVIAGGGGRLDPSGAGVTDVGGGRSRDQESRDMRAGMLGVDPGACLTAYEAVRRPIGRSSPCVAANIQMQQHLFAFCPVPHPSNVLLRQRPALLSHVPMSVLAYAMVHR